MIALLAENLFWLTIIIGVGQNKVQSLLQSRIANIEAINVLSKISYYKLHIVWKKSISEKNLLFWRCEKVKIPP